MRGSIMVPSPMTVPLPFGLAHASLNQCVTPSAGMNFNHGRTKLAAISICMERRPDKKRHTYPRMLEFVNNRRQLAPLANGVEASFRRALRPLFGNKTDGMRPGFKRNAYHFFHSRHFEIKWLVDLGLEPRDIVVTNVAPIFPQMRRDPIATCSDGQLCRAHRIGVPPPRALRMVAT